MRSEYINNIKYPERGRFKQSLIAGLKPGESSDKKGGTFKAVKIEFLALEF